MADRTPNFGELVEALHALEGIFQALDWIEGRQVTCVTPKVLVDVRAQLVLAGKHIALDVTGRI